MFARTVNENTHWYNNPLMRKENYIKTRGKIIYAVMKTVCNNTETFYGLKLIANPCLNLQLIKTHGEIITPNENRKLH